MSNITTFAGLKNEIQKLEDELSVNRKILNDQFIVTYEIFKPVNLIRNAFKKLLSPSFLIDKLMGPAMGLAAGIFLRK
jgi:hypothetical protein